MKLRRRRSFSQEAVQGIILGAGGRDFHNFEIDLELVIEDFLRGKNES